LRYAQDFDAVLLGISVSGVREVCADLMAADRRFADHVNTLSDATCATQAMQLWTVGNKKPHQPQPVVVRYSEPYDTVTDMSHLIPAEATPANGPTGITYLCSAIKTEPPPPRAVNRYPQSLRTSASSNATQWLKERAPILWTNLAIDGKFDWN